MSFFLSFSVVPIHTPAYTRLQTVWSLPGHSRQANKDHSPLCHRRPNGPGRIADKVVQPIPHSLQRGVHVHSSVHQYKSAYLHSPMLRPPEPGGCHQVQQPVPGNPQPQSHRWRFQMAWQPRPPPDTARSEQSSCLRSENVNSRNAHCNCGHIPRYLRHLSVTSKLYLLR